MPDIAAGGYANVLQQVFEAAQDDGLPVTFTLATGNTGDPIWPDAITMIEKFNSVGKRTPRSLRRCSLARSAW